MKKCKIMRLFGSVGYFCGKPIKNNPEHLFLNCPYYKKDGVDICTAKFDREDLKK